MRLILRNGYPYPFPTSLTEEQRDALAEQAASSTFELNGIVNVEWLHTLTIELNDDTEEFTRAQTLTGWSLWGPNVLEATTSEDDGYGHPAIIVHGMAYCGFMLVVE